MISQLVIIACCFLSIFAKPKLLLQLETDAKSSPGSRIVGGMEAVPGEFPWMAYVITTKNTDYMCGGSVISSDWVMTAGHCLDKANAVTVILGEHNKKENEPTRVTLQSRQWHIHPDYAYKNLRNDIGLIKLPTSVSFTNRIRPISLTDNYSNLKHVNDTVIVTGWGKVSDAAGMGSDVLRKATTTVISNESCQQSFTDDQVTNGTICTSGASGKKTCYGDSGGPMIYNSPKDGSWIQIGITSFGHKECELGFPNVFTRVQYYVKWIESVTGLSIDTRFTCLGKSDGNHANPSDCATFYMCSNEMAYLFSCPGGLVFNANSEQCDYRQSVPECNN